MAETITKIKTSTAVKVAVIVLSIITLSAVTFVTAKRVSETKCTGKIPAHAILCPGDKENVNASTSIILTTNCSEPKCQYTCREGYKKEGNTCIRESSELNEFSELNELSEPNENCKGLIPDNSDLCPGDDTNVRPNTPITLTAACSVPKCQYTCKEGYEIRNGNCVSIGNKYSCISTSICDSCYGTICPGDDTGLTSDLTKLVVTECTNERKCEYLCNAGYIKSPKGNFCVKLGCKGSTPSHANLCPGDNQNVDSVVNITTVPSYDRCTNAKCEYYCHEGYKPEITAIGPNCVERDDAYCSGNVPTHATLCPDDESRLETTLSRKLVPACSNDRKCEYTCNEGYTFSATAVGSYCFSL